MVNIEKVIKGMKTCMSGRCEIDGEYCPYNRQRGCTNIMMQDAIELLKEKPQIVRCKDCKWSSGHEDGRFAKPFHCRKYRDFHEGDWFCKDGEPKGT